MRQVSSFSAAGAVPLPAEEPAATASTSGSSPPRDGWAFSLARPGYAALRLVQVGCGLGLSDAGQGRPERLSRFFASLTSGPLRDAGLRAKFNSIDTDRKGHINKDDLVSYAVRNGLPVTYAHHFLSAVLRYQPGEGEVTYDIFRTFVRSREEALQRAFNLFDRDKDGHISVDDLDATLGHVAVCCPKTRCVYRCRRRMASELLQKTSVQGGQHKVGFSSFRDFFLLLPQTDMMVEYWLGAGTVPDLDTRVAIREHSAKGGSPWGHLMAGAVAGATSRTATAPLETLRLAAMSGQLQTRSLAQAATDIVNSQGVRGLYRGNLVNVIRSAPQKGLDFFAFDAFKRLLGDDGPVKTFMAAGMAGVTSWVALYPLEVVRSRVTIGMPAAGTNLVQMLSTIVRCEGVGALYRGLGPSVAAIFPEAAITYGLHDTLKRTYTKLHHREPDVGPSLAFGVLSAFTGQLVSFPLETVSRRLQISQTTATPAAIRDMVAGLIRQGGPAALYRGIGAATLRLVPMACVSFGTYELVRSSILAWEQQQDEAKAREELHTRCVPLVLNSPDGGQEVVVGRVCTPAGAAAGAGSSGAGATGVAQQQQLQGALSPALPLSATSLPPAASVASLQGPGCCAQKQCLGGQQQQQQ